jgi:hypothetical protein
MATPILYPYLSVHKQAQLFLDLFTFTRFPKSQRKSIRRSNAILVRQLSAIPYQDRFAHHEGLREEFKRGSRCRPCCLPGASTGAKTAAMSFRASLASGQIIIRKIDG